MEISLWNLLWEKIKRVLKLSKSREDFDIDIVSTKLPLQSEYLEETKQTEDWKNASEKIDERMAKLMEEKRARKNIYKTYNPGENIFVRIGKKKRKIRQKT